MAEQERKLFPTVPLGFDKRAVISYIERLNQAYEQELAQKEEMIRKLREQLREQD